MSLLSPQAPDTPHDRRRLAWRIAGLYAALASLWILGSDLALLAAFPDTAPAVAGSLAKGGLFVAVTSVLLFAFLAGSPAAEASLARIGARAPLPTRGQWRVVVPFAALAVALIAATGWLFLQETHEYLHHARTALEARAESKAHELELWLKQRAQSALSYRRARFVLEDLPGILRGEPATRSRVASRLEQIRKALDLNAILVLDTEGRALLATGAYLGVSADLAKDVAEVARTRTPRLHALNRADGGLRAPILLDQIVPVEIGTSGEVAPAVMVLRDDAASTLLQMLRRWTEPSRTAEAYLTRQTGMWIEYLSELREKPEAALTLGAPVTSRDRTAAQLFRGADFLEEAVDYRGKNVMAAGRVVPGTDWRVVVKIDRDEVLGPIRGRAGLFVANLLGIILLSGLGAALLWRQQAQLASLRERATVAEREALIKHYDYLSKFAHDFIFLLDDTGRIVEINDRVTEVYQWPREELIGRPAFELRAPGHDAPEEERQKILRAGSGMIYETVHRRRDGTTFPVEISARGIEVEGRRYVQGIVRDITERKRMEAALKEQEERLRDIVEHSTNLFYSHTPDHVLTYVSPQSRRFFDCEPEEARVRWTEFLTDNPVNRLGIESTQRAIESGEAQPPYELELSSRRGRRIWVQVNEAPVVRDGKTVAVVGALIDVTERKRAEAALKESEERFRAAFEQAGVGMAMRSIEPRNSRWLRVNQKFCDMLGYTREELLQLTPLDITPPEDRGLAAERYEQLLNGEIASYSREKRYVRKDGRIIWINTTLAAINGPDGRRSHMISVVEDITSRKEAETRIARLTQIRNALSDINRAIVHADNEDALLSKVCAIAVRHTGFLLAWVGIPDEESGSVLPLTSAGGRAGLEYLARIRISFRDEPEGLGPTGTAIRGGRAVVVNDVFGKARNAPWHEAARDAGVRSSAALPLRRQGKIVAVLSVHSPTAAYFDSEIVALLEEMTQDVSFSLDVLAGNRERKRAQDDLAFKNVVLATQQETSPDAILVVDEQSRIISYNRKFVDLFRVPDELVGAGDDESVLRHAAGQIRNPEAFLARVRYLYQHREESGHDEIEMRDGRFIERHSAPMSSAAGDYLGRVWYFRDITDRRRAADELRESERRFSNLLGTVKLISLMLDREARITYCNDYLLELTGWRREEILGRSWFEHLIPPDAGSDMKGVFAALLANLPEAWHHENDILTRAGERRVVRWNNTVLRSATGEVIGTASIGEDITESRKGEQALRESEARFRALLEQSISGFYLIQDNRFKYVNARFAEIFGYGSPGEIFGKNPMELVALGDRATVAENIRRRLAGEIKDLSYSFTGVRKDGSEVEVGVHGSFAVHGGHPAIMGLLQDISERKRAEEEIKRYIARLEQAMRSTISVVSAMGELRDPYTHGHERRVGELAAAIAKEMGLHENQVEGIRVAGYLHDVGKIGVPAEILSKPAKLSPAEYALVKDHAQQSYEILKTVRFPWPVAEAAWQHHERLDGSGYPRGLKGDDIIIEARILAVADVVEAMSSHRPYRPGMGAEKALAEIEKNRGKLYDPQAADACLRLFRERDFTIPD